MADVDGDRSEATKNKHKRVGQEVAQQQHQMDSMKYSDVVVQDSPQYVLNIWSSHGWARGRNVSVNVGS